MDEARARAILVLAQALQLLLMLKVITIAEARDILAAAKVIEKP